MNRFSLTILLAAFSVTTANASSDISYGPSTITCFTSGNTNQSTDGLSISFSTGGNRELSDYAEVTYNGVSLGRVRINAEKGRIRINEKELFLSSRADGNRIDLLAVGYTGEGDAAGEGGWEGKMSVSLHLPGKPNPVVRTAAEMTCL